MILCTFEDGTTELRPADSSAIAAGGSFRLWMLRGDPTAQVPRGGEWVPCRVETSDEQIDRLTRERDAVIAQCDRRDDYTARLDMAFAAILGALHGADTTADAEKAEADLVAHDTECLPIAEIVRRLLATKES